MNDRKATMYATAQATIACAKFKEGAVVAVRFDYRSDAGVAWFSVSADGVSWVAYPEHHLTRFCL